MRCCLPLFLPLFAIVVGCTTPLATIDKQVQDRVTSTQSNTLGDWNTNDPRRVPVMSVNPTPGPKAYVEQPPTTNSSAADLPVNEATSITTDPNAEPALPRMLDLSAKTPKYNLKQILAYAIEHAPDYRNRKETLFIAAINVLAEEHLWGPRFFDSVSAVISGPPERGDHDQALTLVNELGVSRRLPYGGTVSASALVDYVTLLRDASGDPEQTQSAELVFAANVPLLRGAGWVARESLIQSRRNLVYATRTFEEYRRSFLLDLATSYFDLLRQRKTIENLDRQVKNFEWLYARIEALANAGRQAYFEVQETQQQVFFARNNLLNAQERYASQLDSFKILIGMPVEQAFDVEDSQIVIAEPALDPIKGVRTAHDLRLDLQTSADVVEDSKRRAKVAANRKLPDLELFANVNLNTNDRKNQAGIDIDPGQSTYSVGAQLDLPLDRRVEELDYRRALIEVERAARSYTLLRDQIAQAVRSAIRQIEQARFTLDLQNRNVEISTKRIQGVKLRLRTLEPRRYTEAQEDLLEAENRRDEAERDLRVSILQYLLETGQMRVTADGHWLPPAKLVPAENSGPTIPGNDNPS